MTAKQFSIFVENKVGQLAKVCGILADAGVYIHGFHGHSEGECGIIRVTVDKAAKARAALKAKGLPFVEKDVLVVVVSDKVGAGAQLAKKLGNAGISVDYAYATSVGKGNAAAVLEVSDLAKAKRVLGA